MHLVLHNVEVYAIYMVCIETHTVYIDRQMHVCVCILNADHIDFNVELIKMGDILISAGNKVFWVIFMGKMVTSLYPIIHKASYLSQGRYTGELTVC